MQVKSWMKVPPVQSPRYLHVQHDLSVGILIIIRLGAIGCLRGPDSNPSGLPGLRELVPIAPAKQGISFLAE